ncbi:hypothetical protein ACNJX9_35615 [Bradyrhizobium sp. DASA03076]|uniref:hypothetical protein n=1 Tax=Bradyrhizobium sp. BLXBL-03 TaxID=3395916 RepID=UPI003F709152
MDPIDPLNNTGAWMQQYSALRAGQQSENASEQGSFERQMERLQLNSTDESSTDSSSPHQSPVEDGREIRRADIGGSMRMPSQSRLGGNSFRRTRHSVDIPRTHLGSSTEVLPHSNLRDDLFSSARYGLPMAQPAMGAKSSKSRGLWSRIKSGVTKALGGTSGRESSGSAAEQEFISTTFRADHAKQPGRTRGVPDDDKALFEEFKSRATGTLGDGTIRNAIADLRHFSARLSENGQASIADRIGNPALADELDNDADTYAKDRSRRIKAALKKLRDVGAGKELSADIRRLNPYPADATLIDIWAAAEKATQRIERESVDRQARRLYRLSDWLQAREREAMAGRLFTTGLTQDVEAYRQETKDSKINADLLRLKRYQQVLDANRALGLQPPVDAPPLFGEDAQQPGPPQEFPATPATPSSGAWAVFREAMREPTPSSSTPQPNWFLELPATPATPSAGAWDLFREAMQGPAPSSSGTRPPSDIYGGLDPLVNLDPPTPHELRDDAHWAPAPAFAGPPSFAGPSRAPQELREIGHVVGEGWEHRSQPASPVLVDILDNINLLPNQYGPSQFLINGELYSATLGAGGRRDVRLIHHPRARPTNEAGPSYQPQVDIGPLIRGGWQHRERWLPDYLIPDLEGERLMPSAGRPTSFYIRTVPYRAELQETNRGPRIRLFPQRG